MIKRMRIITIAAICLLGILAATAMTYIVFWQGVNPPSETHYIYIDEDDNADSLKTKSGLGWKFDVMSALMTSKVRTGMYEIKRGMPALALFRQLRNGQQTPIRLVLPGVRTLDKMAAFLGENLMMDSTRLKECFADSSFCQKWGYTPTTLPALFIPNTYEVYWNTSIDEFMKRMKREHHTFWNQERLEKAEKEGLTLTEVATLASIIDEETANNTEKPMIAGMYINRLRKKMMLQADPTVKYALGEFGLQRIYHEHLKVKSPYNTYQNTGLPPGPIRVASIVALDAVLNHAEHRYIYMCAKEDFSGTHNFASSYSEHLRNARRYARALNNRKIK